MRTLSAIVIANVFISSSSAVEHVPVVVVTTLGTDTKLIRQYAFDGDPATFFRSDANPRVGDHFTLVFDVPVAVKSIHVVTDEPGGPDSLDAGTLEVSADGKTFVAAGEFARGEARVGVIPGEICAVRVRPTADQSHSLAIHEITIESGPPLAVFRYPIEFTVDASDSPELKGWAEEVARLCERWYPRICDELKSDGYTPPRRVSLRLTKTYRGVAMASGDRITGATGYFKEHLDDVGAMIHETTHVVQQYRGQGNPGWLVEGVADYVRNFIFEPGKLGPVNPDRARYSDSYRTSAVFLAYLTETYDKAVVSKLNTMMREGKYKESVFKDLTGKTLSELDEDWREALRRRVK